MVILNGSSDSNVLLKKENKCLVHDNYMCMWAHQQRAAAAATNTQIPKANAINQHTTKRLTEVTPKEEAANTTPTN